MYFGKKIYMFQTDLPSIIVSFNTVWDTAGLLIDNHSKTHMIFILVSVVQSSRKFRNDMLG